VVIAWIDVFLVTAFAFNCRIVGQYSSALLQMWPNIASTVLVLPGGALLVWAFSKLCLLHPAYEWLAIGIIKCIVHVSVGPIKDSICQRINWSEV
jgi:uncharacterized membrane protein SirB2